MGNYYWRYLLQRKNIEEALKWLEDRLSAAIDDKYAWCITLSHLQKAKLWKYSSKRSKEAAHTEYEKALKKACEHKFASLTAEAQKEIKTLDKNHMF